MGMGRHGLRDEGRFLDGGDDDGGICGAVWRGLIG
jgi:hypothetical protein